MRKILCILMSVTLLFTLCSCSKKMPFEEEQLTLVLLDDSTGRTDITINRDGTFTGRYVRTLPDEVSEAYPDGTVMLCDFDGEFTKIKKLNDYAYKLTTDGLNLGDIVGSGWIENGVQYISAAARGIEDTKEFILYLPETPTNKLSQEFLSWCPHPLDGTLPCYGLLNTELMYGFFELN